MTVTNPNMAALPEPASGILGGLTETQWQALMSFLIAQLGGSGWPKWPAPGQPLSWYAAPATGWSVNGGADGLPVQPVATETVTLQQVVDYVRSVWPGTLNGVAFPALGSTVTVPTSTGGSMSVTVTLDGTGVQHAAASLGLEF